MLTDEPGIDFPDVRCTQPSFMEGPAHRLDPGGTLDADAVHRATDATQLMALPAGWYALGQDLNATIRACCDPKTARSKRLRTRRAIRRPRPSPLTDPGGRLWVAGGAPAGLVCVRQPGVRPAARRPDRV